MMSIAVSLFCRARTLDRSMDVQVSCSSPPPTPVPPRSSQVLVRFRIDGLFEVYDLLPDEVRAELPLRRAWMPTPT